MTVLVAGLDFADFVDNIHPLQDLPENTVAPALRSRERFPIGNGQSDSESSSGSYSTSNPQSNGQSYLGTNADGNPQSQPGRTGPNKPASNGWTNRESKSERNR